MDRKDKLSPENFLDQFARRSSSENISSKITTSQLSDALKNLTGENGVLDGLKPISSFKIFGKATTVKTSSKDWGTVIRGIYTAEKGNILVISCDEDDTAVWGELASKTAQKQGIAGTVIYGASRDISGIKQLGYPVFSRKVVPNAGDPLGEGEINIPVNCGDTIVNPGDFIMGDECGVVSVPMEISFKVLKEAENILDNENFIIRKLNDGKSFMDILGLNDF